MYFTFRSREAEYMETTEKIALMMSARPNKHVNL